MQQRFKKVRTSWMEELVASLTSNPILACDFAPLIKLYKKHQFSFQPKSSIRTLSIPQLSIDIEQQIVQRINEKALRTRKTYQANLLTDSLDNQITNIEELPPESLDGDDEYHTQSQFFKIGLAIVRQEGIKKTKQRIERQLRHCSQRSGARFSNFQAKKDSSDLYHLLLSFLVRVFLAVQQKQKKIKIARLVYYPKVDIQIQKTKIDPFNFCVNQIFKKIRDNNIQNQTLYGYVSPSENERKQIKVLTLLTLQQLQQNSNCQFPLVGVFVVGKLGGQLKQESLFWALIMQYLSNPLLNNRRLSLSSPNTGILLHFEQKNKTAYQFEVPTFAKWKLSTTIQTFNSFPKQIAFATRQVIMEQDREQSEVQSVHPKQVYPLPDGPSETYSSRSFDQKDVEIARLKAELEKYKNQNEWLKQLVANLTSSQSKSTSKANVASTNYPSNNGSSTNLAYQASSPQGNFSSYSNFSSDIQIVKQREAFREKQFKIRDSKNISFAQQNSYEEQNQMGNFLQDEQLLSPQFNQKEVNISKQQVKAFQFSEQIQEPYFQQQKKKPSSREPLQTFTQNKTRQTKTYQDSKYQPRNGTQASNYHTNNPIQQFENMQVSKNQPLIEKETGSPKKTQKNEINSQRSKAIASIAPRQTIQVPKKYLEQEMKQSEKKEVPKKMESRKKQYESNGGSSKKAVAINSQSDDEEVNKIIAERNRRK